jgi:hypothetical protein
VAALRLETTAGTRETVPVNTRPSRLVLVLAYIAVMHIPAAVRDLRERPAAQVRGDRRIWRVASILNASGSFTYWLLGRRPAA